MSNIKFVISYIVGYVTGYIILYVINAYGFFYPPVPLGAFVKIMIFNVLGMCVGLFVRSIIYGYYKNCKSKNTDNEDDKNKH